MDMSQMPFPPGYQFPIPGAGPSFDPTYGQQFNTQQYNAMFSSNPPTEAYGTFGNMASQSTAFQASNPAGYGGYSTEFGPGFNNPGTGYSTYQYSQEGVNAPAGLTAPPPTHDPGSTAPAQSAAPVADYNSYGFQQSNYDQNLGTYSQGSSDLAQGTGAYAQSSSGFDQGTSSYEQSGAPQYTQQYEQANQPYTDLNTQPGKQSMDWTGNNQYYNYNLSQNEESSIVGNGNFQTGNLGPVNTNTYSSTDQYTSAPAFDQSSGFVGPTAAYTTGDGSGQQSFTKPMGNSAPQTQKGFSNMPASQQSGPVSHQSGPAAPNSQGGNFEAFSHFNQNAAVSANSDFSGGGRGRGTRGGYQGGFSGQGGGSQYYGGQDMSTPPAFGVSGFSDQQGDGSLFPGPNNLSNNDVYSGQFGDFSERNNQSTSMAGRGGRGGSFGNGGSRGAGMAYRGVRDIEMLYPQDQTDVFANQQGSVQGGNFSDMTGRGLGFSDLGSGVGGPSSSGSRGPLNHQNPEKSSRAGLLGQYGANSDYPKRGLLDDAFPDVSNDQHMGRDQFSNLDNNWKISGPGSRAGGSSDRGSWGGNFGNRGGRTGVSNRQGGFSERSGAGDDSDVGWRGGGALLKGGLSGGFSDSGSLGGLSNRGGRSGGVYDRLGPIGGTGVPDKGGRGGISRGFEDRDVQDGGYSSRGGFSGGNIDKMGSGRGSSFADRGGRGGGFSDRGSRGGVFSDWSGPSGMFSDKGGHGGGFNERASGSGVGYFDKNSSAGEFPERGVRDSGFFDRGSRGGGFSDRGGRGGGFSDRGGRGGGFSDRGGRGSGFPDRGDREIGFADSVFFDKGGRGGGFSNRGGQGSGSSERGGGGGFSDRGGRGGTFSNRGGRGGGSSDRGGRGGGSSDRGGRVGEFSDRGGYNGGNLGRSGQSSASNVSERGGRAGEIFGRGGSIAAKSTPVPLSSLGKQGTQLKTAGVQAQDARNTTVNPKGVNTAQLKAQTNTSIGNKATVAPTNVGLANKNKSTVAPAATSVSLANKNKAIVTPAATNVGLANKNKATVTAPATNIGLANKATAEITKKDVTKAPSRPQDRLLNEIQEKEKAKQAALVKRSPDELKKEEEKRLEEEKRKTEVAKQKAEEEKKQLEEERKKAEIELRNKIADEAVRAAPPVKPPETPEEVAREQEIQRKIRESVVIVNPIQEQVLLKDDPSKDIEMSEELRKLLKTLMTEVLCKLCSVRVAGPQMASMHYNGKNHVKKVRNFVQTNGRSAGFNMETAGKEKEGSLKEESNSDKPAEVKAEAQVAEITDIDENQYCKVCKVSFAQDCQAQMHYKGKNHAKKIKSLESGPALYECKVCCVTVTAQEHLTAHLNGARHKAQVRKLDTAESFRGSFRGGRGRGGGGRGRGAGDVPSDMNRDTHAWTPLPDARHYGPGGSRGRGGFGSSTRGGFGSSSRGAFDSSPRGQGFGGLVPLMFEGLKRRGAFEDGPSFRGMMQPPFAKRPRF